MPGSGSAMKKQLRWLRDELPKLVEEGVLAPEQAVRLHAHYGLDALPAARARQAVVPVLGAVLAGLGVLLLLAHNWDGLARAMRVALALAPLLMGQLACLYALTLGGGTKAWREGAAAFTAIAFTAALALVGQIFHLSGDLDRFLLTCGLVALPLVYLLRASFTAALCALAFGGWVLAAPEQPPLLVTGVFLLLAPHVVLRVRAEPEAMTTRLLLSALLPLALFAVGATLMRATATDAGLLWFAHCVALLWMAPTRSAPALPVPLPQYGLIGLLVLGGAATFGDFWQESGRFIDWAQSVQVGLLQAVLLLALLFATTLAVRARQWWRLVALPPVFMLWATLAFAAVPPAAAAATLLANGYALAIGVTLLVSGLNRRLQRRAHGGLMLVSLLVLLRFLDSEWSFTARGVAFLLLGVAFLLANLWLRRRVPA